MKSNIVFDLLSEGLDVFVITESWHGSSDNLSVKLAMPPGFCFLDFLRPHDGFHGGIVVYYKSHLKIRRIFLPPIKSFESVVIQFFLGHIKINLVAIYRPGSSQITNLFFDELKMVLEHISVSADYILLAGDLNVHVELPDNPHAMKLTQIFEMFQLLNIVNLPTHVLGGTLDLVVSSNDFPASYCTIGPSGLYSDHSFIEACFPVVFKLPIKIKKSVRSWNKIDDDRFSFLVSNLLNSELFETDCVDTMYQVFEQGMEKIIDEVAPLHYVTSRIVPSAPWFNDVCRQSKRVCRKLERVYRKNPNEANKCALKTAVINKTAIFVKQKNNYWKHLVESNKANPKKLWNAVNKILCKVSVGDQSCNDIDHNSTDFALFFANKIKMVREMTKLSYEPETFSRNGGGDLKFSGFNKCTADEIKKVIINSPAKSCSSDSIPSKVLKKYVDLFLPYFTKFVNLCLRTGFFPSRFKHAIVTPVLKKTSLDKNNVNNYRPVSNLKFLSKLIERIVLRQLLDHLQSNALLPTHQSGYRRFHSTETALLDVSSELYSSMDAQHVSLLALLDMSAAFDCVDHELLLNKLEYCFNISGIVAAWIRSYLSSRTQQILFNNKLSAVEPVLFGVPQGSVLGPILFLMYTADVFKIIDRFNFSYHAFADDIQIIAHSPAYLYSDLIDRVIGCLSEIDIWMSNHRLKLNQSKTQLLPVGTWQQLRLIIIDSVLINDFTVPLATSMRNLGVIFDRKMSFELHVKALATECRSQLRGLRLVKGSLNVVTLGSLMHAFIHSRVDYCNSLFCRGSDKLMSQLQCIQNQAARLLIGRPKFDHITPILRDLHWLPVSDRSVFKIAVIVYKCLHGSAPLYLTTRIAPRIVRPGRQELRSDDLNLLILPRSELLVGSNSFSIMGPTIWNNLPHSLRQPNLSFPMFRKQLKAFLFAKRFIEQHTQPL